MGISGCLPVVRYRFDPNPAALRPQAKADLMIRSLWNRFSWKTKGVLTSIAALAAAYVLGFFWFLSEIPEADAAPAAPADAIVVLTGGPERIDAAMSLLAEGKGKRLLVSGVYPGVTREALKELVSVDSRLFDCCVDVDWRAESTIGNAAETATWAEANGFQSLIVVTSAYHLPRALRELSHTLPNTTLTGHAVFHEGVHLDNWWLYSGTARLLVSEYSKFLLTLVRLGSLEDA